MAELWIGLSATREGTGPSLLLPLLQDSHSLTIAATDCLVPSGEDSALTATREGSATTFLSAMWLPITHRSGDHKTVLGIRSDGLFGSSGSD